MSKKKKQKKSRKISSIILTIIIITIALTPIAIYIKKIVNQIQVTREQKEWQQRATDFLTAPMDEDEKKYALDTPAQPEQNYTLPAFTNMPEDFNIVIQTIKPGKMTRDEAMEAINEKAGKELYGKRSGKDQYYEMYDGVGINFIDEEGKKQPIGTFAFEYDNEEIIRKVYYRTLNEHLEVYVTPHDAYQLLGKADHIAYSPSKYHGTEYIYSSKGITFIGKSVGIWGEYDNLEPHPPDLWIYSLILYEPMTYEEYVESYTEMTPFYEELVL